VVEYMLSFLASFFANPSAWGIGLAVVFGAIWLTAYWSPLFKKPWLWAVLVGSATVAFHTASCALAGWGVARGWGGSSIF
jgi:hypothetical protein